MSIRLSTHSSLRHTTLGSPIRSLFVQRSLFSQQYGSKGNKEQLESLGKKMASNENTGNGGGGGGEEGPGMLKAHANYVAAAAKVGISPHSCYIYTRYMTQTFTLGTLSRSVVYSLGRCSPRSRYLLCSLCLVLLRSESPSMITLLPPPLPFFPIIHKLMARLTGDDRILHIHPHARSWRLGEVLSDRRDACRESRFGLPDRR